MNQLTEKHVQHLASFIYRTGRADSPEAALSDASAQVQKANQANIASAARTEAARRQEAAHQLRDYSLANQQSAARQRHTGRTLDRLTAAVIALGRR